MPAKLTFSKPNIWQVLTILTCLIMFFIFLFGFWFEFFKFSQTNKVDINVIIFAIIFTFFILLIIFLIFKKFANKDYLELNTQEIIVKINGKEDFIPYQKISKIDFSVVRILNRGNYSYILKIITLDKTFFVSNLLVNFWNFKESYLEMTNFVEQNKIKINITKNFDYKIITIKNNIVKIIFVGVWLYFIFSIFSNI